MFEKMKMGNKLIGAFIIIIIITAIVGYEGYRGLNKVGEGFQQVVDASSVVNAAMDMKLAVTADMQMIMEILAAGDKEELDAVWQEHQSNVAYFDKHTDAILNGANTDGGVIYASKSDKLRAMVNDADAFHNNKFQPNIEKLRDLAASHFITEKEVVSSRADFITAYNHVITQAEKIEGLIKDRINKKIGGASSSAAKILSTENTWADVSMEIKTTITKSRGIIGDSLLAQNIAEVSDSKKEYDLTIAEFDNWVNALLNGAETTEGKIAKVTDPKIREMIALINKTHDEEFQVKASSLMALTKNMIESKHELGELDKATDEIGILMIGQLGEIETIAKGEALNAKNASDKSSASSDRIMLATTFIGVVIALFLGIFFSKNISKIINALLVESTKLSDAVEAGDLKIRADVDKINFEFQGIVKGMNNTVEAFVKPIKMTSDYVGQISKGIVPATITEEYRGDFNEIKVSLNTCIDVMGGLLNETNGLITAAQEGELDARGNSQKFQGSWCELIGGINEMLDAILEPIREAKVSLEHMADSNLTKGVSGNYRGDHAIIKDAINASLTSLNDILGQVSMGSQQITAGAQQVSDSSQSLSQGATEQASSLEQITTAMTELGSQTKQNAENATQANQLSKQARDVANTGNKRMQEMTGAMEEINSSSKSISKIIKVIDEIAFQTNLLALNAAVEAARAGKHGKGFAVVAEEVRNLAARSAKAAKETADLIEGSVKKVETGGEIASKTAEALGEIVSSVTKVTDLVGEIAAASNEQAQGITQINQGLVQIDQVTQQNTANAEESASAAVELSGQASQLQGMLQSFKLTGESNVRMLGGVERSAGQHYEPEAKAAISHHDAGIDRRASMAKPSDVIALDDSEFGKY